MGIGKYMYVSWYHVRATLYMHVHSTIADCYYTDIDRDGHEISRFGGLPRELYFPKGLYFPEALRASGKYNHEGEYNYLGTTDMIFHPSRSISVILDGQNE